MLLLFLDTMCLVASKPITGKLPVFQRFDVLDDAYELPILFYTLVDLI